MRRKHEHSKAIIIYVGRAKHFSANEKRSVSYSLVLLRQQWSFRLARGLFRASAMRAGTLHIEQPQQFSDNKSNHEKWDRQNSEKNKGEECKNVHEIVLKEIELRAVVIELSERRIFVLVLFKQDYVSGPYRARNSMLRTNCSFGWNGWSRSWAATSLAFEEILKIPVFHGFVSLSRTWHHWSIS